MCSLTRTAISLALFLAAGHSCLAQAASDTQLQPDLLKTLAGGTWEMKAESAGKTYVSHAETFEEVLGGGFLLAHQTTFDSAGTVIRKTVGVLGVDAATGDLCSWIFFSNGATARLCALPGGAGTSWLFEGEVAIAPGNRRALRTRLSLPEPDLLVNEIYDWDAASSTWRSSGTLKFRRRR